MRRPYAASSRPKGREVEVAFLIRSLDRGGTERQLVTLAGGLRERGHSIVVFVFYPGGPLEEELREVGVRILSLDKRGRWDVPGFLWRLARRLRQEAPNVLHGYIDVPNILAVLVSPLFPKMRVVWGVRASNVDLEHYGLIPRIAYATECALSRFADLIIANSQAGREYSIANGFPETKVVVIPNGIDVGRFRPDSEARRRVRAEWGVHEDEQLIGLVGRLDPMKDYPTFLKAAALLSKERDDARFVCVGGGPKAYTREMEQIAYGLGIRERVIWAGPRADMPAVYNAFDVAASSSTGEGFSNVIGEAMACGVPCVVTDVGDSAWIVGEIGSVVPARNPQALAQGWASCLRSDRRKLGREARSRIMENFSVSRLVEQTEKMVLTTR